MKRYLLIVNFFLIATSISKGQSSNIAAANKFVGSLFQNGEYISYSSTRFRGYSEKLKLLKTPLLKTLLPDYTFYSTFFLSNYMEYFNVETALAFSASNMEKSQFIHSPVFTSASKAFLRLFYGLHVNDTIQRVKLAEEIMGIFSEITYHGRFERVVSSGNIISFALWHDRLNWRTYEFYYDSNNNLMKIEIFNRKGGAQEEI